MTNPEDFAVVIGVSRYTTLPGLPRAMKQAEAFASWLTDQGEGGLLSENVQLLTHSAAQTNVAGPTRHDVVQAFERILKRSLKDDQRVGRRLYIYMAGHGFAIDSNDEALLMVDASADYGDSAVRPREYADFFRDRGNSTRLCSLLIVFATLASNRYRHPLPGGFYPLSRSSSRGRTFTRMGRASALTRITYPPKILKMSTGISQVRFSKDYEAVQRALTAQGRAEPLQRQYEPCSLAVNLWCA
jgi:hypothetical protein